MINQIKMTGGSSITISSEQWNEIQEKLTEANSEVRSLRTQLAKANERADELLARVGEAEARLASAAITGSGAFPSEALNKFAIEKKIEGVSHLMKAINEHSSSGLIGKGDIEKYVLPDLLEQLRKEQERC